MKLIKPVIISFIVFSLLITGFSLFIPSHIRISRATDIHADRKNVMLQISDPVNWQKWFPGADTAGLVTQNNIAKGIQTGKNQQLIITTVNDSAVRASFAGGGEKVTLTGWNIFNGGTPNTVTIQWFMDFNLHYPWEKFSGLMFEGRYGPAMEQGLHNLKTLLEK